MWLLDMHLHFRFELRELFFFLAALVPTNVAQQVSFFYFIFNLFIFWFIGFVDGSV